MTTLTIREAADALETDPRLLRKYLRQEDRVPSPGKGGRYEIPTRFFHSSVKRTFPRWVADHTRTDS